jgi:hypothetical protein
MLSTTLVRLIDESIIPALLLIFTKIGGVLLTARIFDLPFEISPRGRVVPLPSIVFLDRADYLKANAYSNLVMFAVVSLGFLAVLIRAHHLHSTHIHPHFAARLERLGLSGLIGETADIYHQALVWLLFSWFVVVLMGLNSLSGFAYLPLTVAAFLIALNLTWFLIFDVEREIVSEGELKEEAAA